MTLTASIQNMDRCKFKFVAQSDNANDLETFIICLGDWKGAANRAICLNNNENSPQTVTRSPIATITCAEHFMSRDCNCFFF